MRFNKTFFILQKLFINTKYSEMLHSEQLTDTTQPP